MPDVTVTADKDDMCPICRSSRYLNPDMRFLVNPECYHKMCESCVDRIFSGGPAPCPYKGCGKTLRKPRFKQQVFDDLAVEREVDVRQRVVKAFNRRRDQFDSDGAYNDYLERVETLIFDITEGTPAETEAAERELAEYEQTHRQEILQNAIAQRQEDEQAAGAGRAAAERQQRLRLLAIDLEQRERELKDRLQQELVQDLAAGTRPSDELVRDMQRRVQEQTAELRRTYEDELAAASEADRAAHRAGTRGPAAPAAPRTPFTPFAGDFFQPDTYRQRDRYFDPTMEHALEPVVAAGGFSARIAQAETLTLAFMGLDVDIQAEKAVEVH